MFGKKVQMVYLLTNPSLPGIVHFGLSKDPWKSLKWLNRKVVVKEPFELLAYFGLKTKLSDHALMGMIGICRPEAKPVQKTGSKDKAEGFYKMEPREALDVLEAIHAKIGLGNSIRVLREIPDGKEDKRQGTKPPEKPKPVVSAPAPATKPFKQEQPPAPAPISPVSAPAAKPHEVEDGAEQQPSLSLNYFIARGTLAVGDLLWVSGFPNKLAAITRTGMIEYQRKTMTPPLFVEMVLGHSVVDCYSYLIPAGYAKSLRGIWNKDAMLSSEAAKKAPRIPPRVSNITTSHESERKPNPIKKEQATKLAPAQNVYTAVGDQSFPTFASLLELGVISIGERICVIKKPEECAVVFSGNEVIYKERHMAATAFARQATGNQYINTYKNLRPFFSDKSLWELWEEKKKGIATPEKESPAWRATAPKADVQWVKTPAAAQTVAKPVASPTLRWFIENDVLPISGWIRPRGMAYPPALILSKNKVLFLGEEKSFDEFARTETGCDLPEALEYLKPADDDRSLMELWKRKEESAKEPHKPQSARKTHRTSKNNEVGNPAYPTLSWLVTTGALQVGELIAPISFPDNTAEICGPYKVRYKGNFMDLATFAMMAAGIDETDAYDKLKSCRSGRTLKEIWIDYRKALGHPVPGEETDKTSLAPSHFTRLSKKEAAKKAAKAAAKAKAVERANNPPKDPPYPTFSWIVKHKIVSKGQFICIVGMENEWAVVIDEKNVYYKGERITPYAFVRRTKGRDVTGTYENIKPIYGKKTLRDLWKEKMIELGFKVDGGK